MDDLELTDRVALPGAVITFDHAFVEPCYELTADAMEYLGQHPTPGGDARG